MLIIDFISVFFLIVLFNMYSSFASLFRIAVICLLTICESTLTTKDLLVLFVITLFLTSSYIYFFKLWL